VGARAAEVSDPHSEERNVLVRQPSYKPQGTGWHMLSSQTMLFLTLSFQTRSAPATRSEAAGSEVQHDNTNHSFSQEVYAGGDAMPRRSLSGTVGIRADMRVSSGTQHCLEPPHSHLC